MYTTAIITAAQTKRKQDGCQRKRPRKTEKVLTAIMRYQSINVISFIVSCLFVFCAHMICMQGANSSSDTVDDSSDTSDTEKPNGNSYILYT